MAETPYGRQTSLSIRLLRTALKIGGRLVPGVTSLIVYRIWFKTRQYPLPKREHEWLKTAREFVVDSDGLPVTVYEWGEGPVVLLIHGWSGRGAQLGCIATKLAEAGYRAVAIDLPAHGKTPGNQTNAFAMAKTIHSVAKHYSSVHGIVTHSFGAVPGLYLLRKELDVNCAVCICPPDTIDFLYGMFVQYLEISLTVAQQVQSMFEKKFGESAWQEISPVTNVSQLKKAEIAALVVHDEDDREVSIEHGEALVKSWPGANLYRTSGLGHRRILRDAETVDVIVKFIAGLD